MCSPSAPDTSGQQAAALQMSQLSAEQLAWAKSIYAETAPDRAAATQRAGEISDAQLEAQRKQTALTDDYAAYQKGTFRPLEQSIVDDANTYDTPERQEAAASKATAGVEMSLASQRGIANRELERSGVTPGSGKQLALAGAMDIGSAKLKAGAASAARTQVETIGAAKKMDAASLGRGLASSQATSASLALNQGNSSAANMASIGGITGQGAALVNSGYTGAQSGLANAASTYGSIAQQQNASNNSSSGLFGALGSVAGQYAGSVAGSAQLASIFSDENLKEEIEPVDENAALAAVEKTPVKSWAYKAGTLPDDGGKKHVGPMAQDVKKTMGAKVAPGGKKIDVVSMLGTQMAAIQGLSKKVDGIMAMRGIPA